MSDVENVSNSSSAGEKMDNKVNGFGDDGDSLHEADEENNATGGTGLEADFQEVLDRLDNVEITADLDMTDLNAEEGEVNEANGDDNPDDSRSVSPVSSASDNSKDSKSSKSSKNTENIDTPESSTKEEKDKKTVTPDKKPSKTPETKVSKSGSVFSRLKRLTKFDKSKSKNQSGLSDIKIDKLPQVFVVKYLGKRDARGVHGLQYVRRPVDKLVGAVKKELNDKETVELPLVYVVISGQGIDIREHRANKLKDQGNIGLIPIDFVSYGVQDIKYWRVFTFIVVKQMSSRSKDMKHECHAVLCDSSTSARKMALSLGASFGVYKKKLNKEGKTHNFTVELRPPDELAEAYAKEYEA